MPDKTTLRPVATIADAAITTPSIDRLNAAVDYLEALGRRGLSRGARRYAAPGRS